MVESIGADLNIKNSSLILDQIRIGLKRGLVGFVRGYHFISLIFDEEIQHFSDLLQDKEGIIRLKK